MNVEPNKSECVWANARHLAFATAVRAFPLTSTCQRTFVPHSSGISFDVRSFTTY